jgi:hypothetical protein
MDPRRRLRQHWNARGAESDSPYVNWLASLSEKPLMDILEVVPHEIRYAVEREWTLALREHGHDLLNVAAGVSMADETKTKIGDAQRGVPLSDEHKAKISAGNAGKPKSDAHRASLSAAKKGKPLSAENRAAISEALTGKSRTVEHQEKLNESYRANRSTSEWRAKMSEAQRARYARQRAERENKDE